MENIVEAIKLIAAEKDLTEEVLFDSIQAALVTAYKKNFGNNRQSRVTIDRETGEIHIYSQYEVVEEVEDDELEISLADAKELNRDYEVGDIVEKEETPRDFGRISALAAKQVVVQRIREAERSSIYEEYKDRENELINGIIQRINNGVVYFDLGKAEALLLPKEQVRGERYAPGMRFRTYLAEVRQTSKAPQILVSRTHPGLVRRLFELEVPEIQDGDVLIKSIAREAGSRTKIAVAANTDNIDPIGTCVGPKGNRVNNIVDELGGEKIDIILFEEEPEKYIENALSPSRVTSVEMIEEKTARVVVPDYQLSLAIGKEGQNARLAAKLTGYKIDILSESQAEELA
ncbi:MAG TPA: transcription termination/antitermination protein NusA [Tissierellia bacterium]|nr:transcription termination/antitermination protein NusA [Tissierellia bacterium]